MLSSGQQHRLVGQVPVGEQAEGGAAVADVAEAEQAVDERDVVVQVDRAHDERLRELVEADDAGHQQQVRQRALHGRARTSAQRSQTPGCTAGEPTFADHVQQRSHFAPGAWATDDRERALRLLERRRR